MNNIFVERLSNPGNKNGNKLFLINSDHSSPHALSFLRYMNNPCSWGNLVFTLIMLRQTPKFLLSIAR